MLTPNVDWLRKIRAEFGRATPSPASYPSIFVSILDALLAEAPPDGAAEPTEAPAAETGRTDTPPWDDPAFLAAVRARGVKMLAVHAEFDGIDFAAGWNAALAARPAAVTDAMADQVAERVTSGLPFNNYDVVTTTKRDLEQRVRAAALAARGPA